MKLPTVKQTCSKIKMSHRYTPTQESPWRPTMQAQQLRRKDN